MALTPEQELRIYQLRQELDGENSVLKKLKAKKEKLKREAEEIEQMRANMGETSEVLREAKVTVQASASEAKSAYSSNNSQYLLSIYDSVTSKIDEEMAKLRNMNAIGAEELEKVNKEIQTCEKNIRGLETSISNKRAQIQHLYSLGRYSAY